MFFIAYAFKGQVHVFAGRVKIVSHLSCRTSAILKYFCPLLIFASSFTLTIQGEKLVPKPFLQIILLLILFDLILYIRVNNFSVLSGQVLLVETVLLSKD